MAMRRSTRPPPRPRRPDVQHYCVARALPLLTRGYVARKRETDCAMRNLAAHLIKGNPG